MHLALEPSAWSTGASFIRAALSETEMGWSKGATLGEPFGGWLMDSPDKVENFAPTIFNETRHGISNPSHQDGAHEASNL